MRALLVGAAGFIGSNSTRRLLAERWAVTGVDNFTAGRRGNLDACLSHPRFDFIEAYAVYPLEIADKLDWVFHFASPASPPKYLASPIETLESTPKVPHNLLTLAHSKGASFFFASTSEIYGDPLVHPQPESYWGHVVHGSR